MGQGIGIAGYEPLSGTVATPTTAPLSGQKTIAVDVEGKHLLLPFDGDSLQDDAAIQRAIATYKRTGKHLGVYATLQDAQAAHAQNDKDTQSPAAQVTGQPPAIASYEAPQPAAMDPQVGGPTGLGAAALNAVRGPAHLLQGAAEVADPRPAINMLTQAVTAPAKAAYDLSLGKASMGQALSAAVAPELDFLNNAGNAYIDVWKQAGEAFKRGDVVTGLEKTATASLPAILGAPAIAAGGLPSAAALITGSLLAPLLARAEDIGAKGEIMRAIGQALAISGQAALGVAEPSPLGRTGPAMPGQEVPGGRPMPGVQATPPSAPPAANYGFAAPAASAAQQAQHPPAAEVAQYADANKMPIPADVRTGNPAVRGLRGVNAGSSFAAGHVESGKMEQFADRARQVGQSMVEQASPTTKPDAIPGGPTLGDELASLALSLRNQGQAAYKDVEQLASDPSLAQQVNVKTPGRWHGASIMTSVPTMMQLPVDLSALKRAGSPLLKQYEVMRDMWPDARKASSPAWPAIKNIIEGPDVMPFEVLDRNLSGLKAIARDEGGTAKLAVSEVEQALQRKLNQLPTGSTLKAKLLEARTLWAKQATVSEVAEKLRNVKANESYKALSLEDIEALKKVAPEALPIVARGWLQQMMNKAFEKPGQFDHAAALYADWMRMNNRVKFETFGPARVRGITLFFRTAAEVMKTENTSKTAHVLALWTKYPGFVGGMLWHPLAAGGEAAVELSQAALAHMLWDPRVADRMAKALKVAQPISAAGGKVAAAAMDPRTASLAAELVNAARAAGVASAPEKVNGSMPKAAEKNEQAPVRVGPYTVQGGQ